MDWKQIIKDLLDTGMTQSAIAEQAELTNSMVSELVNGHIKEMFWAKGDALLRLHAEKCHSDAA